MSTNQFEDEMFVNALSKALVQKFAPEEVDMFDELAQEYFYQPVSEGASTDDPLGFGLDLSLALVTPAVLAMTTTVLNFVMASALEVIKDESKARIQQKIKDLFTRLDRPEADYSNSQFLIKPEDRVELRRLAVQRARDFGFTTDAERMADELLRPLGMGLAASD